MYIDSAIAAGMRMVCLGRWVVSLNFLLVLVDTVSALEMTMMVCVCVVCAPR